MPLHSVPNLLLSMMLRDIGLVWHGWLGVWTVQSHGLRLRQAVVLYLRAKAVARSLARWVGVRWREIGHGLLCFGDRLRPQHWRR